MRNLIKNTPLIDIERDTEIEREEKKAKHPAGFEHTTSLSQGVCSTAVLQQFLTVNTQYLIPLKKFLGADTTYSLSLNWWIVGQCTSSYLTAEIYLYTRPPQPLMCFD